MRIFWGRGRSTAAAFVLFALIASLLAGGPAAVASTVKVNGVTATPRADHDISGTLGGANGSGGIVGFATIGWCTDFFFKLPTRPPGQHVIAATFAFSAQRGGSHASFTTNADLYALPARSSATAFLSDYFNGPFGTDPAATPLVNDLLTAALSPSTTTPVTVSDASLVNYLNAQYAASLPASSTYVILWLSPDYTGTLNYNDGLAYYDLSPARAATAPTLSLTFDVPEPRASPVVISLAAAMYLILTRQGTIRRSAA